MERRARSAVVFVSVIHFVALATNASAQGNRDSLIAAAEQAYFDFDSQRASTLLRTALDPALGPTDRRWMVGLQLLAQILIEGGRESVAGTWLRWGVRLEPTLAMDTLRYLDAVDAYTAARTFVGPESPGDTIASWEWTARDAADSTGFVRLEPVARVPLRVSVNEQTMTAGERLTLSPGSYRFTAEADGFAAAEATREVLPGIVTILRFNLAPAVVAAEPTSDSIIPPSVLSSALAAVVRLRTHRYQTIPACGTGFVLRSAGLMVTTYTAIRGADSVDVDLSDGRRFTQDVMVAAYDTSANVAVLRVEATATDSLLLGDSDGGPFAWALGQRDCQDPAATRTRVAQRNQMPEMLSLAESVSVDAGAPLVDRRGAVLGLMVGVNTAVPVDRATPVIEQAVQNEAAGNLLTAAQVALRERHAFGAIQLTTADLGASATITPAEPWHWSDAGWSGVLPTTFAGPMGSYAIELRPSNADPYTSQFTLSPGFLRQLRVSRPTVALPAQIAVRPGKKFPWPLAVLGVAAAGGAVALLAGGGGGPAPPEPPGPPDTGGIIIVIPNR